MEQSPSWEASSCLPGQQIPKGSLLFTRAYHWALSWAREIKSTFLHPVSLKPILIVSSHLHVGLPRILSLHVFALECCMHFSSLPCALHALHLIILNMFTLIIFSEKYKLRTSSLCNFLHSPVTSSLLGPNTLLSALFSITLEWQTKFHTHIVFYLYTNDSKHSPNLIFIHKCNDLLLSFPDMWILPYFQEFISLLSFLVKRHEYILSFL